MPTAPSAMSPVDSVAATEAPGTSSWRGKPPSGPAGAASTAVPAPAGGAREQAARARREAGDGQDAGERPRGAREVAARARRGGGRRGRRVAKHLLDRRDEHDVVAVLADALGDRAGVAAHAAGARAQDRGAGEAGTDAGGVDRRTGRAHEDPRSRQARPGRRSRRAPRRRTARSCVPRTTDSPTHRMPGRDLRQRHDRVGRPRRGCERQSHEGRQQDTPQQGSAA